jgi:hypothetical protein
MPGFSLRPIRSFEDVEYNFRVVFWLLTGRADDANIAAAGTAGSVAWDDVTNKPSEFVPTEHGNERHTPDFAPTPHDSTHHSDSYAPTPHDSTHHSDEYQPKQSGSSLPTPSLTYRGTLFTKLGDAGVADEVYICVKNASDNYEWIRVV